MKYFILIVCLLVPFVAVNAQSPEQPKSFVLKDIQGRRLSLRDYKGRVVLVNFWATWCPPCRTEIPALIKLQKEYRNQGLRIIGITYPPQSLSEVRHFAQRLRMNYRVALGTKTSKALLTGSATLPVTVVIDRDGAVRDMIEGIMYREEFDQKVKPLLAKPH
jgi:thiol-disulfide isomerase/thioredoxin